MTKIEDKTPPENHKARIAGGAGLAFIGRLGAFLEVGSLVAFTWLYGGATFGLFAALWAYVKVWSTVSDIAMTTALQRFVPAATADDANKIAGFALKTSFLMGTVFALVGMVLAPTLANFVNASEADAARLVTVIRIYVWVLPFWTLVEVATAAVRARRTFGPEIRVRIFYEQGLRLLLATIFALVGMLTYGLFFAHLASVVIAAALALRLVAKHYNFGDILRAPLTGALPKEIWAFGLMLMPSNITKRLFSEFPVIALNLLLPGAAGAAASGYYAVARKLASALQVVRLAFEYVMAPLASEKEGAGDRAALGEMYAFATRLSLAIALPFAAALILARHDILATMKPEFQAATVAIAILCAGRVFETATGPSSAIIEMLGHKLLPALNGILGLAVLLGLSFQLVPAYGISGAAVAAALGLGTTALAALFETAVLYRLVPYSRETLRPLFLAIVLAGGISAMVPASTAWDAPTGISAAVASLVAALVIIVRYGLSNHDAEALGKLGRLVRR